MSQPPPLLTFTEEDPHTSCDITRRKDLNRTDNWSADLLTSTWNKDSEDTLEISLFCCFEGIKAFCRHVEHSDDGKY